MTFRSRTLYQLSYNGETLVRRERNGRSTDGPTNSGGRGRIRTSVARKERQIYSLLPLAARPPVQTRNTPTQSENHLRGNSIILIAGGNPQPADQARVCDVEMAEWLGGVL